MPRHPLFTAYAALGAVCFFWGTTYLAIRMALEMFPPLVLLATRFLISGGILLASAKLRRETFPSRSVLFRTALNGLLILGVGNGCLTYAETLIPSGLAALFITTAPFWLTGMEALIAGGEPLHRPTVFGMLVGFAGVVMLVGPDALGARSGTNSLWAFLILQIGNLGWCLGSIFQKRLPRSAHAVVNGAIQQFAVGVAYLIAAILFESGSVHFSWRGTGALLYLVTFGSIIGYSAYVIALERLPVAMVSLYNYINPVVAIILGWLVYREPFGFREAAAMAVIFLGVWLVKRFSR